MSDIEYSVITSDVINSFDCSSLNDGVRFSFSYASLDTPKSNC